jgi:hypothetical protein
MPPVSLNLQKIAHFWIGNRLPDDTKGWTLIVKPYGNFEIQNDVEKKT